MIPAKQDHGAKSSEENLSLPRKAAMQILLDIKKGAFSVGERLPPQRELSETIGISRASLREAISILETDGILRTVRGSGTYVARVTNNSPAEAENTEIGLTNSYNNLDLCRFRYVFEPACARLAAMRIREEELDELISSLERFKEFVRIGDFTAGATADQAFHHLIIKASGVQLFIDLHNSLRSQLLNALTMPEPAHKRGWEPVIEHERILEALRRRDPDEASYYMQSHVTRSSQRLGYVSPNDIL